jgi:ABC-2 type transport system permease protein
MSKAIYRKYIRESALLWCGLAAGLFFFSWFRVWVVSEISATHFRQILELLPKDWRQFSPVDFDWLVSYVGRTAMTLDEPMIGLLIGVWAIARGSDVVSGELSRGTLEMILAQPVERIRMFGLHALLTLAGLAGLVLLVWLGMTLAIVTTPIQETTYPSIRLPFTSVEIPITALAPRVETKPMLELVKPVWFFPGVLNLYCFGCFWIGVSMLGSSVDRFRWRTIGVAAGLFVSFALIKIAALSSKKFAWLKYATVFTLFEPAQAIEFRGRAAGGIWQLFRYAESGAWDGLAPMSYNILLLAMAIVCFAGGRWIFDNRDLPAAI